MPKGFHKWRSPQGTWKALKESARGMRKEATSAEDALWERLRNRQVLGFKFRRQHTVGRFVLDFYCPEAKLGVEVDGSIHHELKEVDRERERHLQSRGICLLRFSNKQVMNDSDAVSREIAKALNVQERSQ